jgi:hypothetical protein
VVGVGGLVAMAMLTLLVGRSTTDTPSSTTVIAAPGQSTPTTRSAPSAAPDLKAPPFDGGWIGDNWFDSHNINRR